MDGIRKPAPAFLLTLQLRPLSGSQRRELRRAASLSLTPLGTNPPLLHLQHRIRNLLNPLGDSSPMFRLQRNRFKNQQVSVPRTKSLGFPIL
jgi:hypothetical protein